MICDDNPGIFQPHLLHAWGSLGSQYGTASAPPKLSLIRVRLPHGLSVKRSKKFITNQSLLSQSGPWLLIAGIFI